MLLGYWKDPNFNPKERAFYYVRVIEIPTPRWTTYDAKFFGTKPPAQSARPRSRTALTPRPSGTRREYRRRNSIATTGSQAMLFPSAPGARRMKRLLENHCCISSCWGPFFVYSLIPKGGGSAEPGKIVVTQGQIASMAEVFARAWQRPPYALMNWRDWFANACVRMSTTARRWRWVWKKTTP